MPAIPTALFASTTLTVAEAAVPLHVCKSTVYEYIAAGMLPARRIGRQYIIPASAVQRLVDLGTDVVRAQLFHASNARGMDGSSDPEVEAREAAEIAKHRASVARARLRLAREKDLSDLPTPKVKPAINDDAVLPEISDPVILKAGILIGAISDKPVGQWTDDQIRELLRRARMADASRFEAPKPSLPALPPPPPPPALADSISLKEMKSKSLDWSL